MEVIKAERASNELWDAIVNQCEYSTFYHSREWAELREVHSKGKIKPAAQILTLSDGTEVLLPMSVYKLPGGLVTQYVSSAGWWYGGWLATRPLTQPQIKALWDYVSKFNIILRQNTFSPDFTSDNHIKLEKTDTVHVLDLEGGFETLTQKWAKNNKSFLQQAKQGVRLGLVAKVATELEEWKQYYQTYIDSIERWGDSFMGPKYEWDYIEYLYRHNSPHIKLWVAKHEGQVISGEICLYQNKVVHGWQISTFAQYFSLRPVQVIHYSIIQDACEKGYGYYDLGPSGNSKGVDEYKSRMGFVKKDFNLYVNRRIDLRTFELTRKVARKVVKEVAKEIHVGTK